MGVKAAKSMPMTALTGTDQEGRNKNAGRQPHLFNNEILILASRGLKDPPNPFRLTGIYSLLFGNPPNLRGFPSSVCISGRTMVALRR